MSISKFLIFIVVLCIVSMFVVGCATKEIVTVKETKTVYKPIPEQLMIPCKPKAPMSVDNYMSLDQVQRERWLADYVIDLMETIGNCNNNLKSIRDFNKKQSEIFNGK